MTRVTSAIIALMLALLAIPPNTLAIDTGPGGSFSALRLSFIFGATVGLFYLFARSSGFIRTIRKSNVFLLLFLGLATLSAVWSINSGATFASLFRFYVYVGLSVALCLSGWHPARLPMLLMVGSGIVTVGSIIYFLVDPSGAVEQSEFNGHIQFELLGSWRGIALQKNTLGAIAAIGLTVASWELIKGNRRSLLPWIVFLASAICVVKSRSSTSIFASFFSVAVVFLVAKLPMIRNRRLAETLIFGLTAIVVIYSLAILNIVPGLSSFINIIVTSVGKDMSFSGRTAIWGIMMREVADHPLLGTGYAAFWTGPEFPSPAAIFKILLSFYPSEAHNGYLDVLNELGIVGLILLLGFIYQYLRTAVRIVAKDRVRAALYIGIIFLQLIGNLSESYWMNVNISVSMLIILATFDMCFYETQLTSRAKSGHPSASFNVARRV